MADSRKNKRGILGVRKTSSNQLRPFGKHSEPYGSDSSDSDYLPDDVEPVKKKAKRGKDFKNLDKNVTDSSSKDKKRLEKLSGRLKPGSRSHWDTVPTEILIKIFHHVMTLPKGIQSLLRCGEVCKQWYYAFCHPLLWRKLELSFMAEYKTANDKTLQKLVDKRGQDILEMYLTGWNKLTIKSLMEVANKCLNLQAIGISKCTKIAKGKKTDQLQALTALIDNCDLRIVDFSWMQADFCSGKVIKDLVEKRGCLLESLNVSGSSVGSPTLQSIQAFSSNLRVLDLSNTCVYQLGIEKLQIGCPRLEELYMANIDLDFTKGNSKLQDASNGFVNLIAISVNTVQLTDQILLRLLKSSNRLKLLDIRRCISVTMKGIEEIPACSVERLFLSKSCLNFSFDAILKKWHGSLTELDLSWLVPLFNVSCFKDVELERIEKSNLKMNKLASLDLTGTPISDHGLRSFLSICPNLNLLDLTSCKGLPRGMKHKHDRVSINKLRSMRINS